MSLHIYDDCRPSGSITAHSEYSKTLQLRAENEVIIVFDDVIKKRAAYCRPCCSSSCLTDTFSMSFSREHQEKYYPESVLSKKPFFTLSNYIYIYIWNPHLSFPNSFNNSCTEKKLLKCIKNPHTPSKIVFISIAIISFESFQGIFYVKNYQDFKVITPSASKMQHPF